MTLFDLGFDEWFQERQAELEHAGFQPARVTAVDRDRFLIRNQEGELPAEITGRLRFSAESSLGFPAVGDWVQVQYFNQQTLAIIHEIYPRRSLLCRKTAGKKIDRQLIAANIDTAFIMQSCDADFSIRRMERYLVMVHEGNIEPVILLSKSDLVSAAEASGRAGAVRDAGIRARAIPFSNTTGDGLEAVESLLRRGRTFCLLGSSGVGKTTLLNRLAGRDLFDTRSVRTGDSKGRHTTTRRQLAVIDGGALLIDTPGMREFAVMGAESGIDDSFPDISALSERCRFSDCTHMNEAGCAVLAALKKGDLDQKRYSSYLKLVRESAYHQMSYVDKRRKDRKFGQFIKSVMKTKKKKR